VVALSLISRWARLAALVPETWMDISRRHHQHQHQHQHQHLKAFGVVDIQPSAISVRQIT
jgi:hypothetical protein